MKPIIAMGERATRSERMSPMVKDNKSHCHLPKIIIWKQEVMQEDGNESIHESGLRNTQVNVI
ncbi:hypothetical protein [uncultured Algoriphagus sp.]|uniref:hypothetical protein n=1 Tax=uncultured Algoriphagus sp. TaxID=417365 RepID=UPI0030EEC972